MSKLSLGGLTITTPTTLEEFKAVIQLIAADHGDLKTRTLSYTLETRGDNAKSLVSIAQEGKFATLHLLFQVMNCPDFIKQGSFESELSPAQIETLLACFAPFHNEIEKHPNIAFLQECLKTSSPLYCKIVNKE
jgi:hypothetical protein